jgi:hypothetical protein
MMMPHMIVSSMTLRRVSDTSTTVHVVRAAIIAAAAAQDRAHLR